MKKFQPTLSQKNVAFIDDILKDNNIDLIVEYGSGSSTLYFINQVKHKKCKILSVEVAKRWFFFNIKHIKSFFTVNNSWLERKYWTRQQYKDFTSNHLKPYTPIIEGYSRYDLWTRTLQYGPFIRLHPAHSSKFRFFWNILSPIFLIIAIFLRLFSHFAEEKSKFSCKIEKMTFDYHLITPRMKDQFGESPTRQEYANTGIQEIASGKYRNVLVMIDGGPRHYIVDQIYSSLSIRKNMKVHICLFDAYRPEYTSVLSKRPSGKFYPGNTTLLDGTKFYDETDEAHIHRMSKELWYDKLTTAEK